MSSGGYRILGGTANGSPRALKSFDCVVRFLNTFGVCFAEPTCFLTAVPTDRHNLFSILQHAACDEKFDSPMQG